MILIEHIRNIIKIINVNQNDKLFHKLMNFDAGLYKKIIILQLKLRIFKLSRTIQAH